MILKNPDNLFARSEWRNGVFKNYNTLDLFYVGYGEMIIPPPVSAGITASTTE